MKLEERYRHSKLLIDRYLQKFIDSPLPKSLYAPAKYILQGGGKRIRPLLTIFSCEAVGGSAESALHASVGIEILHNFTLVHDDIMDKASSRRGRATVHTKWDSNVAILTGDALLALAYRALLRTCSQQIQEIGRVFTEGVVEVCEGQAYDKEFESRAKVNVEDYLLMIQKKTGKMVSVATEIGGLIGGANEDQLRALRSFGDHVGRAFQIQDDLLDIIADERTFGKTIGGDLVQGKRTFLLLEALRRADGSSKRLLQHVVRNGGIARREIPRYRRIYEETGAIDSARRHVERDIQKANAELQRLPDGEGRAMLRWFADRLMHRTY